ncbi:bifunctional riboflavin kinase/FAD synthetase [Bermanella marisrubri]|nr:bifunctional riboflavin kinase/FAD synthetase [Bermanella marisrubri]QIZ85740.1 bifunctional riboflavin kinase/FAD synthetase [Bermanella marisrubri]
MLFYRGLHNTRPGSEGCVLTIGNFDGVHLGHQALLDKVKAKGEELSLQTAVMIFEPQPKEFFDPDGAPARLCNLAEKIQLFQRQNIDVLACMAFNPRFRQLTAEAFVQQVLIDALNVKALIVGDDFRFGCDRSGDFAFLQEAGERYGFSVEDTQTIAQSGNRVSSTRVRQALEEGRLLDAAELLGRPYSISGRIAHGQKLGRTIGTPTANVILKREKAPLRGVFAVKVICKQGEFKGVANIGTRPTVGGVKANLEAHLFDFSGDLYGQRIDVIFCEKIRDEKRFDGIDALKAAIEQDRQLAKAYFNKQ